MQAESSRKSTKSVVPGRAVFLGAGASKAFGYPLTSEILIRIREKLRRKKLFGNGKSKDAMRQSLSSQLEGVLPGWNLENIDLPLITDVLSLVDHALLSSAAPLAGESTADLAEFRRLLERAIYEIIDDEYRGEPRPIRKNFSLG